MGLNEMAALYLALSACSEHPYLRARTLTTAPCPLRSEEALSGTAHSLQMTAPPCPRGCIPALPLWDSTTVAQQPQIELVCPCTLRTMPDLLWQASHLALLRTQQPVKLVTLPAHARALAPQLLLLLIKDLALDLPGGSLQATRAAQRGQASPRAPSRPVFWLCTLHPEGPGMWQSDAWAMAPHAVRHSGSQLPHGSTQG